MDDFRVGSVPSSDPYRNRPAQGAVARKRQRHPDDEDGRQEDDADNIFEAIAVGDEQSEGASEQVEDYYLPSDPSGGED